MKLRNKKTGEIEAVQHGVALLHFSSGRTTSYRTRHNIFMSRDEFKKFITLYIKDYNRLSPYGNKLSIDDFKESLKYEWLNIEWC